MYPVLLKIEWGGELYVLHSYIFFLIIAIFLTTLWSFYRVHKIIGFVWRTVLCFSVITVLSLVGARLMYSFTVGDASLFSLSFQGLSIFGGLIGAAVVGLVFCWFFGMNPLAFADSVTAPLASGIMISRIGCLLNGCCYGKVTELPWGIEYPRMSLPHLYQLQKGIIPFFTAFPLPVHPTQIYEIAVILLLFVGTIFFNKRNVPTGVPFLSFISVYSLFRIINEIFRVQPLYASSSNLFFQSVYTAFFIFSLFMLVIIRRRAFM